MSFVRHLQTLDQASCDLLRTARVLAGLDPSSDIPTASQPQGVFHFASWDSERFVKSPFPPAAFIAAFIFWVVMNPPTGPKVPMFAGILSLVILRTPMNPLLLLAVCTVSIFVAVAPVYWIVMPTLSTGVGLISLIFVYSFGFGYLGGRSPALKSGPMLMFVTMSGISNQQTYSFLGTVNGALMIILAGVITAVVYSFSTPMRPSSSRVRSPRQSASAVGA